MLTRMLRSVAFLLILSTPAFSQAAPEPDALLQAHDWPGLEQALSPATKTDGLYRGILLEHQGQFEASRAILAPLLSELAKNADRRQEALARLALAQDEARLFHYKEAAGQFRQAETCCAAAFPANGQAEAEIFALLAAAPPMTLEGKGDMEVPLTRGTGGLRELPVYVAGHPSRWLFDPAAPLARLSRAQAKAIGLKSLGEANGSGVALIPQLRVGGALFRNVPVLLVNEDALPADAQGVLPLPVLALLGTVTATDEDHLTARNEHLPAGAAPLFEDNGQLLAATTDGQLFAIAPASADSALAPRMRPAAGATAANLALEFGSAHAGFQALKFGEDDRPTPFAGTLGGDALDQLAAYTFDFQSMRFAVRVHGE